MSLFVKTRNFYSRFERPISSISLVSGFIFDALTLKRLDTLWENIWILGHIVIASIFIVLIHTKKNECSDEKNPSKAHFWFVTILQFMFGGTLSTFLVFYFRSTDIFSTWPFLLLLAVAFIANESFKKHYVRLSFQISLLFLSIYSFTIFLLPVILHKISTQIFLLSGLASIALILIFIRILFYFAKDKFKESKKLVLTLIFSIFALVNIFYFTNLIPPIPLSLKEAGVYHSIYKNKNRDYVVTYENYGWRNYFKLYPDFKKVEGFPVYAYSAVFSPSKLNLTIVHEWQYYDKIKKKWVKQTDITLDVVGGRDGGFRTYSMRSNLTPGKWKVNIKTTHGKTIGSLRFNILPVNTSPALESEIKK
jgi:hypothetical protein